MCTTPCNRFKLDPAVFPPQSDHGLTTTLQPTRASFSFFFGCFFIAFLTTALLFSLTACQKEAAEGTLPESESQTQTEETTQTAEAETEVSEQAEESTQAAEETEPINLAKEVQNEFYKIFEKNK